MNYFSLPLQLHKDNILVYLSGFLKQAIEACFYFFYCTNHLSPSPSVPRLQYLTSGVSYNSATSIALTDFCSENMIFFMDSLFRNQPPSSRRKMTTPLENPWVLHWLYNHFPLISSIFSTPSLDLYGRHNHLQIISNLEES